MRTKNVKERAYASNLCSVPSNNLVSCWEIRFLVDEPNPWQKRIRIGDRGEWEEACEEKEEMEWRGMNNLFPTLNIMRTNDIYEWGSEEERGSEEWRGWEIVVWREKRDEPLWIYGRLEGEGRIEWKWRRKDQFHLLKWEEGDDLAILRYQNGLFLPCEESHEFIRNWW